MSSCYLRGAERSGAAANVTLTAARLARESRSWSGAVTTRALITPLDAREGVTVKGPIAAMDPSLKLRGTPADRCSGRPARVTVWRSARSAGSAAGHVDRPRLQCHLAAAPGHSGSLPRAQRHQGHDRVHRDPGCDPKSRARDARHQHVRRHLHAADRRGEQRPRTAHRAGDLGVGACHEQPDPAGHSRSNGVDPSRHGDPRPGRAADAHRRSAPYPKQQHHAVPSS